MAYQKEIERKFLVINQTWLPSFTPHAKVVDMKQAYVKGSELPIRVRISTDRATGERTAYLALKTHSNRKSGLISRDEWQFPIPVEEAEAMMEQACDKRVEKTRYYMMHGDKHWTVDEFKDRTGRPLLVAEVELDHPDEKVDLPTFVSPESEVTSDGDFSTRAIASLEGDFKALLRKVSAIVGSRQRGRRAL